MTSISQEVRDRLKSQGRFLVTAVDFDTLGALGQWILEKSTEQKEFLIAIDSSGGSPAAVLHFASFARTLDADVRLVGVAFGECGSAALALLQCCHERIAVRHCGFFVHHVNSTLKLSLTRTSLARLREEVQDSRDLETELVQLQCARTGLSPKQWKRLADRGDMIAGRAIFPTDALKLGLVDKVTDHYALF